MSYQLIFDIKALKEFSNSFDWYKGQQKGLGDRFEQAVYKRLSQIQKIQNDIRKKEILSMKLKL